VADLKVDDHVVFSYVPMCGRCLCCATGRPALCETGAASNGAGTLLGGGVRFHKGANRMLHTWACPASRSSPSQRRNRSSASTRRAVADSSTLWLRDPDRVGAVTNTAKVAPASPSRSSASAASGSAR
jgi:alcohol dehydrogenase